MIVQAIRSAIFYILFFAMTAVLTFIVLICSPFAKISLPVTKAMATTWTFIMRDILLRWVVGIRTRIEGVENIPQGAALVVSKHQSDWDVVALYPLLDHPAFVAKKELFDIPMFGTALRRLDTIKIDRKRGAAAVPEMVAQAQKTVTTGRKIFIFPEGTRKPALDKPNYRAGAARLYAALNVPLVPVALDSGLCWGRNSLILWPGTARARVLEPIPPGLSEAEIQKLYAARIEDASTRMALEAIENGIARPISDALRDRMVEARERLETAV